MSDAAADSGRKSRDGDADRIVVKGARNSSGGRAKARVLIMMSLFLGVYGVIGGRLVYLGLQDTETARVPVQDRILASRPDIVDRNGEVLATDIKTASLYAEPRRIVDADEAIELLSTVLPDIDFEETYRKLTSGAGFVWLKRELTPRQQGRIHALGIPGIGFRTEKRRFYPGGPTASHLLGLVNVDNQGIAGLEKYIDDQGLADLQATGLAVQADLEPVRLSIDLRVQHIVHDELSRAMERYQAIAAGAVVLNAKTGEVLAMASLPDFNPNHPVHAQDKDRLNRMSAGVFEMGSTFKAFTAAMALDSGKVTLKDGFDASHPIRIARFTINDFHGKHRWLTVPEIFIYSSNIGAARMADLVGIDGHRDFLKRLGLLDRMDTELPEVAHPTEPKEWKKLNSITISFGHGMATTPLQTAVAAAALLNGGKLIEPTFLPRSQEQADAVAKQVINESTSTAMRYLFRLNVEKGSGRRANVPGYFVGGKTGTAEKVVDGKYSGSKRFNAFLSGFPIYDPQYVVLVILDEPKPEKPGRGATAGSNTAPTVGNIVRRSAPLLGVKPEFGHESKALLVSYPLIREQTSRVRISHDVWDAMKLKEFSGIVPMERPSEGDIEITGISADSRTVEPGFLFAALAGTKADGARFAADAERRGAVAILASPEASLDDAGVPVLRVDDPRHALSLAAARFYALQPETIVAVTGTSGKTSVAAFTRQIWTHAGHAAASIGTTGVVAPGRTEYGSLTTPDPVALHLLLKQLAENGVDHAAMEASSHGLDQRRLDGVRLAAGGFTNLGRDHMDYHETVEAYHRAKLRLFDTLLPKGAPAVVFADDAWSEPTARAAEAAGCEVLTVGRAGTFLQLKRVEHERFRQRAEIVFDGEIFEIDVPLAGDFQISNALVAAGLAIATGTAGDAALAALEKLQGAPGRLDLVGTASHGAPVYVDYAHKPDALENVLAAVRPFTTGKVIVVFGCGGDRDRGKRPIMGEIAARLADVTIVTDDNPRSEDPAAIRAAILAGAPDAIEIGDRRQAIRRAVGMLDDGDTLVVAGKGHEPGQTIGEKTYPFSDHEEVRNALAGRAA